ncbi:Fe-S cluster assembly protein SufD [Paraburkholderia sp. MMS20-SJTN17]|uniref:Fe-S cluster assembly protein SufD n=1 Tax=Paraburkholderia translucens TaxID=2886945 RepID=A0ABS8KJI0_9BURK|nr:Fe-S cluster assembly protein SufD [Paraburkholderia sp. MMS20-SJTN17]MCC8404908.1 Fe-S cluster assembly protein SufD [Paraburkholderia sp. MMS20-SJTN17]
MSETTLEYLHQAFRTESMSLPGADLPWLSSARRDAFEQFEGLGFPSIQLEDWKYTNVATIAKRPWHLTSSRSEDPDLAQIVEDLVPDKAAGRLVFVNGRHVPRLSHVPALPDGAFVGSFARAIREIPERLRGVIAQHAAHDGFEALNTAFLSDGYVLLLPPGCVIDAPLVVLFLTDEANLAIHPFNAILADARSRCSVVEQFVGIADDAYFLNTVTKIVASDEANVQHCRLQQEARSAFHIARVDVAQQRASRFTSHSFALGGALSRTQIDTRLEAADAYAELNGLYFVGARQHADHHTRIDHEKPHGTSREYYRGVLDGASHGVFNGNVIVHRDAQQSDTHQANYNLLLSRDAQIDTKPQLEIHADDVKCTHGATVGQLDENQLFYLRSRGIDERMARALLVWAFARDSVERVNIGSVRSGLTQLLLARVPEAEHMRGLI